MFKNLDIKTIFILILAAALVLMFIFRPSKEIDDNEDELNKLKELNKELLENNDKLKQSNDSLNKHITEIDSSLSNLNSGLSGNGRKISDLEDGKGQISSTVRVLSADGVASELSEYLTRRESKSSN
jgi:chromosome segregation ATPase